jgi:hypothetical protein
LFCILRLGFGKICIYNKPFFRADSGKYPLRKAFVFPFKRKASRLSALNHAEIQPFFAILLGFRTETA